MAAPRTPSATRQRARRPGPTSARDELASPPAPRCPLWATGHRRAAWPRCRPGPPVGDLATAVGCAAEQGAAGGDEGPAQGGSGWQRWPPAGQAQEPCALHLA